VHTGGARTPSRAGEPSTAERGYLHCGPSGAGHFVKMIHNGIEYGLMAAYAEGLNILQRANVGGEQRAGDAGTAPLRDRDYYRYAIDVPAVAEVWRRGSVFAFWLFDLTAAALAGSTDLSEFSGRVSDSGEGRWTVLAAVEVGAPATALSAALYERFASGGEADFAGQLLFGDAQAVRRPRRDHGRRRLRNLHAAGRKLRMLDPVATRISLVRCGGKRPCSTTPGVSESRVASWSGSSTRPR
jgi:6-phosphogluconate dehydrogenase (decarboxylating)